jgi:molybdopterin synthase sulfur carrier subunit
MQSLTGGKTQVVVAGATVRQLIDNLDKAYPGFKERLTDSGRVKPNISVAIDGEVTSLGMLEKVGENSEVHFLPALGGGS